MACLWSAWVHLKAISEQPKFVWQIDMSARIPSLGCLPPFFRWCPGFPPSKAQTDIKLPRIGITQFPWWFDASRKEHGHCEETMPSSLTPRVFFRALAQGTPWQSQYMAFNISLDVNQQMTIMGQARKISRHINGITPRR